MKCLRFNLLFVANGDEWRLKWRRYIILRLATYYYYFSTSPKLTLHAIALNHFSGIRVRKLYSGQQEKYKTLFVCLQKTDFSKCHFLAEHRKVIWLTICCYICSSCTRTLYKFCFCCCLQPTFRRPNMFVLLPPPGAIKNLLPIIVHRVTWRFHWNIVKSCSEDQAHPLNNTRIFYQSSALHYVYDVGLFRLFTYSSPFFLSLLSW